MQKTLLCLLAAWLSLWAAAQAPPAVPLYVSSLTDTVRKDTALLKAVEVRADSKLAGTQIGVEHLSTAAMRNIPVLMGEKDVLKTIQLLPGVSSAGDGNTGFSVRGGATDQNLILLDGATVYNPAHLLGFFSTFNASVVHDMTLYKASVPASYGGRLSSVVDVKMNEGNDEEYHGQAGIGLITLNGEVEGPIEKGSSSFLFAGRTTAMNLFLHAFGDSTVKKNNIGFYDLNGKLNFTLGKRDQLSVSGYLGQDALTVHDQFGAKWGNGVGSVQWTHRAGALLFTNTLFSFSNYNTQLTGYNNGATFTVTSRLNDWNLRHEWDWYANSAHTVRFGLQSTYHMLEPGKLRAQPGSGLNDSSWESRFGWEKALYADDDWRVGGGFTLSYGLRLTDFSVYGPGNFYAVDLSGHVTDTMRYRAGRSVVDYFRPEPRVGLAYAIDAYSTVKAAYVRTVQNVHLLANSAASLPTDRWTLSNNNIRPEIADQYSLGYYRETAGGMYSWSVEGYYKYLQNQIDYRTGADVQLTDIIEQQLLFGRGRAYGIEGQLKKNTGRLTGWISYTLSKSEVQIDGINNGRWYDATQDRTHNIAVVGIYRLNSKWTLSADWVYYTGNPVSYPSGKYMVDGRYVFYYAERNGYRMPDYHRLDLAATKQLKSGKRFSKELQFSVYNVYNRMNAYFMNFRQDPNDASKTQAVRTSLFGVIPAVSYTIKF
jgi:outer membrane receptor protein involved in Fe transport